MRIVLFGGGHKGSVILKRLLELQSDVVGIVALQEDRHENIWYERVQEIAGDIPVISYDSDLFLALNDIKPDVIFVAGWRYKIPKEQYSIPPKGCIVFHDSLLPKYRGFAPMNWAIINGETKTGATMFYIDEEIDSGAIIAQKEVTIGILDDAKTVEIKISNLYVELLTEWLPNISGGTVVGIPQDHSQATYTCKRTPMDGLIDWERSSIEIYNLVRGLVYPYPAAYSYIEDFECPILQARFEHEQKNYVGRVPGRVVCILKDNWVEVLTGDGSILVKPVKVVRSIKATFVGK